MTSSCPTGWWDTSPSTDRVDPRLAADELVSARDAGRTLDRLLTDRGPFSLADAYAVQDQVTAARLARGERIVGWKLGYTSAAMREQMGVTAPNYGPLTDAMLLAPGAEIPPTALQPRVEPEIGLVLARRLSGPCSVADVLAACADVHACLEVVDSVWTGYRFRLEDNTADGSSAAWVVVGDPLPPAALDDLPGVAVDLSVDGHVVVSATGAAADGHPAAGVAWLAQRLGERGLALEAGDLVITGGLTAAFPLEPGGLVSALFHAGTARRGVDVRRSR